MKGRETWCGRTTSRAGSATRSRTCATSRQARRSARRSSPLHDLVQHGGRALGPLDDQVTSIEQVLRRFGRPDADGHVRDVEAAYGLEHGAIVLVVAKAHDAARVHARQ